VLLTTATASIDRRRAGHEQAAGTVLAWLPLIIVLLIVALMTTR
jgi:hypothetical protein